jgi:DNA-directed RNA polymerase specialized sigma24 family protein
MEAVLNDPTSLSLARQAQYSDVQDMERNLFLAEVLASCDKVTHNIVLRRLEGYSWKEIERRCGVSSGAARERFSSTVQRLRKAFRQSRRVT